jgi:NAD(P)-dependent dehydrogenase (short-subunit alcohol dehydrogenase family)
VPHNIQVVVVCPGLIDSPMTRNMRSFGSSSPDAAFGSAAGLAGRTARAIRNNEGTVLWPRNQVIPLYSAPAIGPINEEIGRWLGASIYAAGKIIA